MGTERGCWLIQVLSEYLYDAEFECQTPICMVEFIFDSQGSIVPNREESKGEVPSHRRLISMG